jgi:hypothetical protein
MDEQQIRQLVRQAIARHLGPAEATPLFAPRPEPAAPPSPVFSPPSRPADADRHVSAARFVILRPPEDTACIVEPSVPCNHCGYCQCLGH